MQFSGEYRLPASREKVWRALNDPDVLKATIPGCESFTKTADNAYEAVAVTKVGPVKARFKGNVVLSDIVPPEGYRISGEGQGGAAGFAKGGANVHLEEISDDETLLKYEVDAAVGGKLAQIGQRLIGGTAKKLADAFFARFAEHLD